MNVKKCYQFLFVETNKKVNVMIDKHQHMHFFIQLYISLEC